MRLLLPLFLLLSTAVWGQVSDTTTIRRLQFGVGAQYYQHGIDITPGVNDDVLGGAGAHLAVRYFDTPLVGFQAELGVSAAGWTEDLRQRADDPPLNYERGFTYLELQLLTQLSIGRGLIQPLLQAGPYLSFPLAGRETLPAGYVIEETLPRQYYGYDFPFRPNYGAVVGAGLNIEAGRLTLQFEGRYLLGFSDLLRNGDTVAATSRRQGYGGRVGLLFEVR